MAQITLYTTPACVYCKMVKSFFEEHHVVYTEKNVISDLQAQEDMIRKSGQLGVPVVDIDGSIIIGFDKRKLAEFLQIKI